ncbi:MAG TPA: DUF2793 domain-containing protein [Sphingomicrobium sp.]|nr:DUF2793 domain-containing protein [Sphingomicrobium sp.]
MDQTARFDLPFLAPGQAQKEWWHNEALQRIDLLLCPVVEGPPMTTPPASPPAGSCFLVASGATGGWAGHDGALASLTDAGWKYIAPIEGAQVMDASSGQMIVHRGGAWESGIVRAREVRVDDQTVVRERQPAIADPAGGTIVDAECRNGVASILSALRTHGLIA